MRRYNEGEKKRTDDQKQKETINDRAPKKACVASIFEEAVHPHIPADTQALANASNQNGVKMPCGLPKDLLQIILSFLGPKDQRLARTCKTWNTLLSNEGIIKKARWKAIFARHFPDEEWDTDEMHQTRLIEEFQKEESDQYKDFTLN